MLKELKYKFDETDDESVKEGDSEDLEDELEKDEDEEDEDESLDEEEVV